MVKSLVAGVFASLLVSTAGTASAAPASEEQETPPLSAPRIAGEVLLGGAFTLGGGIVGGFAGIAFIAAILLPNLKQHGYLDGDGLVEENIGLGGSKMAAPAKSQA